MERLETRSGHGHEVGVLERLRQIRGSAGFKSVFALSPVCESLRLVEEQVIGYDLLDVRRLSDDVAEARLVDRAASDYCADFGILASKMARRDGWNGGSR